MPDNIKVFLETLSMIGISLLGIFGATAVIILAVKLLNVFSAWLEDRKKDTDGK